MHMLSYLTVIWCWVDPRRCCHFT